MLAEIASGGMGTVYRAEQLHPVRRTVALKVIKLGMDSKEVVARFESERQALALMSHPSVAKIFDGGTTELGRPFFAMEFVSGEPITAYCDRHKLSVPERLGLFQQACDAVHHAHTKGIIHRDIKPSNVLVAVQDGKPLPKVIDFGVAKATSQRLTEKTYFTEQGQLIGTPEYMSPEQAEMGALDIDTRTDVYSLGVLLYELLTGALPFEPKTLRSQGFAAIQRTIREVDPPRPSARLTAVGEQNATAVARARRLDFRTLRRQLRGDLDWIVMRAMEKDRLRRYASASELAADIERHRNHEPVLAGAPGAGYRLGKFLRRNRLAVTTVAAVLLVALAGTGATAWQAVRAMRDRSAALVARRDAETERAYAEAQSKIAESQRALAEENFKSARGAFRALFGMKAPTLLRQMRAEGLMAMSGAATPGNAANTAAAIQRLNLSVEQQMSLALQPLQEQAITTYAKFVATSGNARDLLLEFAELLEAIAAPKEEYRGRHAAAELRRKRCEVLAQLVARPDATDDDRKLYATALIEAARTALLASAANEPPMHPERSDALSEADEAISEVQRRGADRDNGLALLQQANAVLHAGVEQDAPWLFDAFQDLLPITEVGDDALPVDQRVQAARQTVSLADDVVRRHPEDPRWRQVHAAALMNAAVAEGVSGDGDAHHRNILTAAADLAPLSRALPKSLDRVWQSELLAKLADLQEERTDAIESLRSAADLLAGDITRTGPATRDLSAPHPGQPLLPPTAAEAAQLHQLLQYTRVVKSLAENLREEQHVQEATALDRKAIGLLQPYVEALRQQQREPTKGAATADDAAVTASLGGIHEQLVAAFVDAGQLDDAVKMFRELNALPKLPPVNDAPAMDRALGKLVRSLSDNGRPADARAVARECLTYWQAQTAATNHAAAVDAFWPFLMMAHYRFSDAMASTQPSPAGEPVNSVADPEAVAETTGLRIELESMQLERPAVLRGLANQLATAALAAPVDDPQREQYAARALSALSRLTPAGIYSARDFQADPVQRLLGEREPYKALMTEADQAVARAGTEASVIDASDSQAIFRAHVRSGEVSVEGRVASASWNERHTVLFINFEADPNAGPSPIASRGFQAVSLTRTGIPSALARVDPSELTGARVQFHGPISRYGVGLQMILTQDSQIEKIELVEGRVAAAPSTGPATTHPAEPAPLDPTDHAAIAAAEGKLVAVEGVIRRIEWSKSGAVLRFAFDTDDFTAPDVLLGIAFVAAKQRLAEALDGDPAERLAGVRVHMRGTIKRYGKGYEMIFDNAAVGDKGVVDLSFRPPRQ